MAAFQLRPALKIDSVTVDAQAQTVDIQARRDGIGAFLLSLLGIRTTSTLWADRSCFVVEASNFCGESRVYCPAANVSAVAYAISKPVEYLVAWGIFMFMSAPMFADRNTKTVGLVVFLLGAVFLVAYFLVRKRITVGFITDSSAGEMLKLKANQSEMAQLTQATSMMEWFALQASGGATQSTAESPPETSTSKPPARTQEGKISASCPHCNQPLSTSAEHGGREVSCPSCSQRFRLPG